MEMKIHADPEKANDDDCSLVSIPNYSLLVIKNTYSKENEVFQRLYSKYFYHYSIHIILGEINV